MEGTYIPPIALTVVSGVFLCLGAIAFVVVAADIIWHKGWQSMMWIMYDTSVSLGNKDQADTSQDTGISNKRGIQPSLHLHLLQVRPTEEASDWPSCCKVLPYRKRGSGFQREGP